MRDNKIRQIFQRQKQAGLKRLALLIDPDKYAEKELRQIITAANDAKVGYIFIGGSLLMEDAMKSCVQTVKKWTDLPVILFPGSLLQMDPNADALLFLSVISGRNPDLLIGRHVEAAPLLAAMPLEVIATGYMLVDCGRPTTAGYISHTFPLPHHKPDIAAATAMAGEMLGLHCIYMDGGSGAEKPISTEMITTVSRHISLPLIVGGGMRSAMQVYDACRAGADIVVVGNVLEETPMLLAELSEAAVSATLR